MNNIILRYLLSGYFKTLLIVTIFFYCFGIILNLFEEIEFFKKLDVSFFTPIILTSVYIPSMIIKLLPFIIFISSMKFIIDIRNNKDLLTMKVFGYSNFKIFFILALTSFLIGWLFLIIINPITSSMAKYYEKTKANYARDIDHLVSFNKNGLWIRENLSDGQRIISASGLQDNNLENITIFNFGKDYILEEKIFSRFANIETNEWELSEVTILKINNLNNETPKKKKYESYKISSIYTFDKISSLYKNFETLSFVDLVMNYNQLKKKGYNKIFLNQSLHNMLALPFFLFTMTALASILIMNTLKKSNNVKIIIVGIISCVIIYYLKDLSIALGKTNRIPLNLSMWVPIILIGIFSAVGIIQINEK
jgi:lipopolysaccharide export system permease protein